MTTQSKKSANFEKNSVILFALMMVANVLNYLFQVIVAKMLPSVADFGVVNVLISVYAILGIPNTVMILVVAKYISAETAVGEKNFLTSVMRYLQKSILVISIVMMGVGIVISPILKNILQLEYKHYIYGVFLASIILLLSSIYVGIFQGRQDFFRYGIQNVLNIGAKFGFSVVLIWIGCGIDGVLLALIFGALFVLIYSARKNINQIQGDRQLLDRQDKDRLWKYIIEVLVLQIGLTIIGNGDVVLVKGFFGAEETGIYSVASVISKIATYVSLAIVATLFPIVAEKYRQKKSVLPILGKSFIYICGSAVGCAVVIMLMRQWIVDLLFGSEYARAVDYIPTVCFYVIALTLLIWVVNFSMAMGNGKNAPIILACGCVGCAICAYLYHDSLKQMMVGMALAFFAACIAILIDILICNRRNTYDKID